MNENSETFKVTDEWYREAIERHFPKLNPDKIPVALWRILYLKVKKAEEKFKKEEKIQKHFDLIEEKKLKIDGPCLVYNEKEPSIIKTITIDGCIVIKGRRGSFNPLSISLYMG